jgi:hypothetical protein
MTEACRTSDERLFRLSADRIVHPSFGEGVVQAVTGPSKIEVLFGAGSKTLVHGRGRR